MTVPATNYDAERAVVGAIMLAGRDSVEAGWRLAARARATGLRPADFASGTNGFLYQLLLDLGARGVPVDALSVSAAIDELARHNLGGAKDLVDPDGLFQERARTRLELIVAATTHFGQLERCCDLVKAAARQRKRQAAEAA